jgi:serine/threonine protein kinase
MSNFSRGEIQGICDADGFALEGLLGEGSFKCAYLVRRNGEAFALKLMEANGELEERVVREVDALSRCADRAVAKIIEFREVLVGRRRCWLLLEEYIGGETLDWHIQQSILAPPQLKGIGAELVRVLGRLCASRIVHRDIKPANVLFREGTYDPVLTDFGIARVLDAPSLTRDFLAQGPGTPLFAAPEQLNNDKHLIDWRTDQYGLALTLAFCLLGHHPYQASGEGVQEAITRVALRRPLPEEVARRLHNFEFSFLLKCLEPWPISRYRRPEDLAEAVRA